MSNLVAAITFTTRGHSVFTVIDHNPIYNHDRIILASICEINRSNPSGALDHPFMGDAGMFVRNVVPDNGKAFFKVEVDFPQDLDVQLSVVVFQK